MKRILTMIIALAMLGSMTFAGIAEQVNRTDDELTFEIIQNGSTGDAVSALQVKLKELGYKIGLVDGIFGPKTENGLREVQGALGLDQTGVVGTQEELDIILNAEKGDGVNLVWDGRFKNAEKYWTAWGNPTVCEIVEIDGQNWMHLISTGEKYQGLQQGINQRTGAVATPELQAGEQYVLSFSAFGSGESIGKTFRCGIHNRDLLKAVDNQEQYWTPNLVLNSDPQDYSLSFTPEVDGTFNIMIGTGNEVSIEAWFTNIKIETGNIITDWSEVPAQD